MLQADQVEIGHSGVVINPDLMNDAVDGENREHEEGLWAAVKSHPWACLWAFIMCFTIVSPTQYLRYWCSTPWGCLEVEWLGLAPLCARQQLM